MNIPAIRGKIGDTIYYSANFSFQQINELVDRKVGNEIYTSKIDSKDLLLIILVRLNNISLTEMTVSLML